MGKATIPACPFRTPWSAVRLVMDVTASCTEPKPSGGHCPGGRGLPMPTRPLTGVGGGAPTDGEDLPQVFILLRKALLQPLQLAQALAALMLHGAHVLDEVELGLGGVVAQDAVVVAALALHAALVLLQVLQGRKRGTRLR